LDFSFSREEELFREAVRGFLSKRLSPIWESIDESGLIPVELIRDMGSQGFFAIPVPEEYGGQGGTFTLAVIAAEEVGYHDPSMATAVYTLLNNAWPYILYLYGSENVKLEILPLVGSGRAFFGIASTEPQGVVMWLGLELRLPEGTAITAYGVRRYTLAVLGRL
jgi:acyl-CoA dehydrogenase